MTDLPMKRPEEVTAIQKSVDEILAQDAAVNELMRKVLRPDVHYGKIPGCPKPSLLQPGAEVLAARFGLISNTEVVDQIIKEATWDGERVVDRGLVAYTVSVTVSSIKTGKPVASGSGCCNSDEDKYIKTARYKGAPHLQNTLYKIAEKRAFVSAIKRATGASTIFTQDEPPAQSDRMMDLDKLARKGQ